MTRRACACNGECVARVHTASRDQSVDEALAKIDAPDRCMQDGKHDAPFSLDQRSRPSFSADAFFPPGAGPSELAKVYPHPRHSTLHTPVTNRFLQPNLRQSNES